MRHLLASSIAVTLLFVPPAEAADYNLRVVDYPGATLTAFGGINNRGKAVGNVIVGAARYPFLYDLKTRAFDILSLVPGEAATIVGGINDRGTTVGGTLLADETTGMVSGIAYVRAPDGSLTYFSHPNAQTRTDARAINDRNRITGWYDDGIGTTAFLYDPGKETFVDFAPSFITLPSGINSRGAVAGRVVFLMSDDPCDGVPDAGSMVQYGFLRSPNGALTYF